MYIMNDYDYTLRHILETGIRKTNRTGIDTLSLFCIQSRYLINDRFPILTKRKMHPNAIFAELLWFLSGSTNNNNLVNLGSNIWTPWVNHDFEDGHGYEPGDFGPIYGWQLRNFGGDYTFQSGGFDQLKYMIGRLRSHPNCRRNLFSLWNPNDLDFMRLPPCHYTFQVYVDGNRLSGVLTQRSCDFPIGVPANIQFYSALIYLLAAETGLEPYEFVHHTIDSHIYVNQIPAVEEYLSRPEVASPRLIVSKHPDILSRETKKEWLNIFKLEEYEPGASIKIPVAV